MSDIIIAILGVVPVIFAVSSIVFAATVRNDRQRQVRLSMAFDRAQADRTRGAGLEGSSYSFYSESV